MDISGYKQIVSWAKELDGVFTIQDLRVAFSKVSTASMYREIQTLIESGDLIKIKRGHYAAPYAKLSTISARIYPKSYISTGTALAAYRVIGSVPEHKIQVVRIGTPTSFTCSMGTVESLSIASKLFFGFQRKDNAYWATAEKAYLDCCYFYYKRKTFSFNLQSDVNRSLLNSKTIEQYLRNYDKRFISYFQKVFWRSK